MIEGLAVASVHAILFAAAGLAFVLAPWAAFVVARDDRNYAAAGAWLFGWWCIALFFAWLVQATGIYWGWWGTW